MQVVWGTKNKASQWKIALRRLQLRIFHSDVAVAQVLVGGLENRPPPFWLPKRRSRNA